MFIEEEEDNILYIKRFNTIHTYLYIQESIGFFYNIYTFVKPLFTHTYIHILLA